MITEFNFTKEFDEETGKWLVFYVEDFPIDLRVNDEIWIGDFSHLFKKGYYYLPENKISDEKFENFTISEARVVYLRYAIKNGNVVKILELLAID